MWNTCEKVASLQSRYLWGNGAEGGFFFSSGETLRVMSLKFLLQWLDMVLGEPHVQCIDMSSFQDDFPCLRIYTLGCLMNTLVHGHSIASL